MMRANASIAHTATSDLSDADLRRWFSCHSVFAIRNRQDPRSSWKSGMAKGTFREKSVERNGPGAADGNHDYRVCSRDIQRHWLLATHNSARLKNRVLRRSAFRACNDCAVFWSAHGKGLPRRSGAGSVLSANTRCNVSAGPAVTLINQGSAKCAAAVVLEEFPGPRKLR